LGSWERAVVVHGKPTSGPGLPIHPPRRHLALERGLEGRDQMLKLVEGHAHDIQELQRTGLQLGEPYTGHGSCLLSLYAVWPGSPARSLEPDGPCTRVRGGSARCCRVALSGGAATSTMTGGWPW